MSFGFQHKFPDVQWTSIHSCVSASKVLNECQVSVSCGKGFAPRLVLLETLSQLCESLFNEAILQMPMLFFSRLNIIQVRIVTVEYLLVYITWVSEAYTPQVSQQVQQWLLLDRNSSAIQFCMYCCK